MDLAIKVKVEKLFGSVFIKETIDLLPKLN